MKRLLKRLIISAYCHDLLSLKTTDKLFNKFRLGGV